MEALVIRLEKSNILERIDNAIPYFVLLAVSYFAGYTIYAYV